jgi:outer membrane receptor protein involved in Fe transport
MNAGKWERIQVVVLFIVSMFCIVVKAQAQEESRLKEVVVTATKIATPVKDIPASVTVITHEELVNQNLPNGDIGDALRTEPGISVRRAYAPFPASVNIRGLGTESTMYLVNGIPTDWQISQAIPVERVERVEIIRGPASALYGANAAGGVINIILKEGGGKPSSAISAGYGTSRRSRSAISTEGGIGKFNYALSGFYEDTEGENIVNNNVSPSVHMIGDCDYDKKGVGFSTGYNFSESSKLHAFYNYFNNRYTRGRPNVGGDWDYNMGGFILDQKIGRRLSLHTYVAYRDDDYTHLYDKGGVNYNPNQKRYMDYSELPAELQATYELGWGHTLTAGMFYNRQSTDQKYNNWVTGRQTMQNKFKVQTLAGYIQDIWKPFDALTLTLGGRYDHWKNYDNVFTNYTNQDIADRTDDHFSPKVGIRYNIDPLTSVWGNYSTGFLAPTSEQLYDDRTSGGNPRQPNPNLKPETTQAFELGVERWFLKQLQMNLAGFYNYTDDKILSWFNASNVWINENIGRTISYGAELTLAYYLTNNWIFNANYTYTHATIDENPQNPSLVGKYLPFNPQHKANLGITYNQPGNFTVSGIVKYLSKQYSDDANTTVNAAGEEMIMDESIVVDLKGTKHFPVNWGWLKMVDLSLSVDNLFNKKYRTYYVYEDPGTAVFMEVKINF